MKFPGFAFRYPSAVAKLPETNRMLSRCASFAARRYYPFHAFKWIDADGGERYVRYTWLPTIDEPDSRKAEAKRRGPDYLFEDLEQRLEREPVRMELEVQIAGEGDDPARSLLGLARRARARDRRDARGDGDRSRRRRRHRHGSGAVVDGIEPSGDPVLLYRPPVYDLSHTRRTAE